MTENLFSVTVDYSQTAEEAVNAGKYDFVGDNVTHERFPHDRNRGRVETSMELVHLNRRVDLGEAVAELDRRGLHPATLMELLAFGANNFKFERESQIIALGSVCKRLDHTHDIPYLHRTKANRLVVGVFWWRVDDFWRENSQFLVRR